jgi:hypothetical protein
LAASPDRFDVRANTGIDRNVRRTRADPSGAGAARPLRHIYSRFNEVLSSLVVVRSFAMDAEKSRFLRDVSAANQVVVRGVATDAGYGAAS